MNRKFENGTGSRLLICSATALLAALTTSCGSAQEDVVDDAPISSSTEPLWLATGAVKWSAVVPVCFSTGFTQAQQDNMRRTVTDNWGRVANLDFTGWGPCPNPLPPTNQVVLAVDPSLFPGQGSSPTGKQTGLNTISFVSGGVGNRTILHEFGHTLGFLHEHPDAPPDCDPITSGGDHLGTQADPDSIMNQSRCAITPTLSPWDIVGVQNAYGRRVAGSLVGMNAQCLDIPVPSSGAGQNLQVSNCNSGGNQRWRRLADGSFFAPAMSPSTMDVEGGGSADGTPVQVFNKHSPVSQNQTWNFDRVEVRGVGNLCMDVPSASAFVGQFIQTFPCAEAGAANQKWNVEWVTNNSVRIRTFLNTSLCIQAPAGAVSGSDLALATCNASASNQIFTVTALGELRNQSLCWDSEWGDPVPHRRMQLYACKPDGRDKRNQQYFLRGNVSSAIPLKCLTTNTTDFRPQSPAQIGLCGTTAKFNWDYYFHP